MRTVLILFLYLVSTPSMAHDSLHGLYTYSETTEEPWMTWQYELKLESNGSCEFSIDGHQEYMRIKCNQIRKKNSVEIVFEEKYKDCFPCLFKKNDVLFELEMAGNNIVTNWRALTPNISKEETGIFFIKSK